MVNAECDKTDLSDLCSLESRKAAERAKRQARQGKEQLPNCRTNDLTYEEEICYARRERGT